MSTLLIKNGTLVFSDCTKKGDIYAENGVITQVGEVNATADVVIDATDKVVFPGFIDLHAHFREPGFEGKETIETGSKAAVAGGYTQVCVMPNTNPVTDNPAMVCYVKMRGEEVGLCRVNPIGAITRGENGESLSEIGKMKLCGAVAISDDGKPVESSNMMRLAIEYAADHGMVVLSHCEDKDLAGDGVVNEGFSATLAGLKGQSRAAEEVMVAREIVLADTLQKHVHLCHLSTKGSVHLVRDAKKRGVNVTAETCPHYFAANDSIIVTRDANTKVNPPVREEEDRLAIIEGLRDGTLDVIATDHAPHTWGDKNVEYQLAAFGISGLETAFGLAYTRLVKEQNFTLPDLCKLMSTAPSEVLGLVGGKIEVGAVADFAICDVNKTWVVDSTKFYSKGKNTPFNGLELTGKVVTTVMGGKVVYQGE